MTMTWCGNKYDWSAVMEGYVVFRKGRPER